MSRRDVLRGSLWAFLAGLALHLLVTLPVVLIEAPVMALVYASAFVIVGAPLAVLATGLAVCVHALLVRFNRQAHWLMPPILLIPTLTGAAFALTGPQGLLPVLVYTIPVGTVTGLAFWWGAACDTTGWTQRARPTVTP